MIFDIVIEWKKEKLHNFFYLLGNKILFTLFLFDTESNISAKQLKLCC